MRFSIINLGCKVNRVESDTFRSALLSAGCVSDDSGDAQLVIINTCTVTGEAEKKTRKAVRAALRRNPLARVVVTGCAAAINPEVFTALDKRVVVMTKLQVREAIGGGKFGIFPTPSSSEAGKIIACAKASAECVNASDECAETSTELTETSRAPMRVGEKFPTRVGIKIQDGCNNACTYCIVHVARGRTTSRSLDEVLLEIQSYIALGVKEIVLTGINLGSYADGENTLESLLTILLKTTQGVRFRLSSIEPADVSDRLIDCLVAGDGSICRHLHLPLQSGSSKILREMERGYDATFFRERVTQLYRALPRLALSTDVIVGFPGETETDFQETLDMVAFSRFAKIHIFSYSKREGTPAALRSDQVEPTIKAERVARLTQLAHEIQVQDYERRRSLREKVLIEGEGKGTTESYYHISVDASLMPGDLVDLPLP